MFLAMKGKHTEIGKHANISVHTRKKKRCITMDGVLKSGLPVMERTGCEVRNGKESIYTAYN